MAGNAPVEAVLDRLREKHRPDQLAPRRPITGPNHQPEQALAGSGFELQNPRAGLAGGAFDKQTEKRRTRHERNFVRWQKSTSANMRKTNKSHSILIHSGKGVERKIATGNEESLISITYVDDMHMPGFFGQHFALVVLLRQTELKVADQ